MEENKNQGAGTATEEVPAENMVQITFLPQGKIVQYEHGKLPYEDVYKRQLLHRSHREPRQRAGMAYHRGGDGRFPGFVFLVVLGELPPGPVAPGGHAADGRGFCQVQRRRNHLLHFCSRLRTIRCR